MLGLIRSRQRVWWAWGSAAVVCLGVGGERGVLAAGARATTSGHVAGRRAAAVLTPWEVAEKDREALEAVGAGSRTHADYERVREAYRAVYHDAPGDMHAAAAVNAVAELLAEEGRGGAGSGGGAAGARRAGSVKLLEAAVGQYEFLRKQYPGSSLRVPALLAEAQIEENDLRDRAAARGIYQELLDRYPRSSSAEEARAGLASLDGAGSGGAVAVGHGVGSGAGGVRPSTPLSPQRASSSGTPMRSGRDNQGLGGSGRVGEAGLSTTLRSGRDDRGLVGVRAGTGGAGLSTALPTSASKLAEDSFGSGRDGSGLGFGKANASDSLPNDTQKNKQQLSAGAVGGVLPAMATTVGGVGREDGVGAGLQTSQAPVRRTGPLAVVKGIRHWSTPNYTRVAIDLGDSVTYEAARVAHPDRIYFDLHGTRLAGELVGKSFGVTDDGFLKRIRAAQFSDDMTRVVLDVNDVTEYSAFLLPNPYRLIIDIHGGKEAWQPTATVGAPQIAAKAAPTVPNTTAVKGATPTELARVSEQPGKVEATSAPTSKPIAAVVDGRDRDESAAGSGVGSGGGAGGGGVAGVGGGAPGAAAGSIPTHRGEAALSGAPASGAGDAAVGSSLSHRAEAAMDGAPAAGSVGVAVPVASSTAGSLGRRGRKGKVTKADAKVVGDPALPARAAVPTAAGETSLVRALGLKIGRIVIDAGHGGHDSGTLGVDGIEEKDVVLDVALRLGAMLRERLGADVIYTRSDDTFVPLETRTAIANKAQADLFLSIHANSSADPTARGVETYYLNFTTQADSLEVAARENAVSDQSIYQLSDLVKKIALKDKIAESREFASDVEASLYRGLTAGNAGLKDRGVKKAPFVVLIGANMPSVLAEISFVTNPRDANQLREPEYRQRVAESLYKGVARYAGGLSGATRAAAATERARVN